jgi:hypothetical protein
VSLQVLTHLSIRNCVFQKKFSVPYPIVEITGRNRRFLEEPSVVHQLQAQSRVIHGERMWLVVC